MRCFEFYWSREGKRIHTYVVANRRKAIAAFKRDYKYSYAQCMGEVYIVETEA